MNDELDDLLASLPTPPTANDDFWLAIDAAIAERPNAGPQPLGSSSTDDADISTQIDVKTQSTVEITQLPRRAAFARPRQGRRILYLAAAAAITAGIAVMIWPQNQVTVDVATPAPLSTETTVTSTTPPTVPPRFDVSNGYVPPELLAEFVPDGAELAFAPRAGDWTEDGVADIAIAIRFASDELAIVVANGATGIATDPIPIAGETVGAFVTRPGLFTITTSDDSAQTVTDLAVDDAGISVASTMTRP